MSASRLVLVSGWGIAAAVFDPLARQLADRRRVSLVDMPGYGGSDSRAVSDLDSLADAVRAQVPDGATVLGWSLGGLVALRLATRRDLEALILIGSTPRFVAGAGWPFGLSPDDFERFRPAPDEAPWRRLEQFAVLVAQGDRRAAAVLARLRDVIRARPTAAALRAGLDILAVSDLRDELRRIGVPVLVVAGARDRIVPVAASRALANRLPHAELHLMAGAAHAPFVGREQRLAARIEAFLATRAAA
ncbi:pimeloyl-ACP methyl ester esterase BioH [soil metagenome]